MIQPLLKLLYCAISVIGFTLLIKVGFLVYHKYFLVHKESISNRREESEIETQHDSAEDIAI